MTRKDYVLIAEALRLVKQSNMDTNDVHYVCETIADRLQDDNSRFDYDRFMNYAMCVTDKP